MSSSLRHDGVSLGQLVEEFIGRHTSKLSNEARYYANGGQWLSIVNDAATGLKFCESLSDSQMSSHILLAQWMTLRHKDAEQHAEGQAAEAVVSEESRGTRERYEGISHHYHLARLFKVEFTFYSDEEEHQFYENTVISACRRKAALYASCYKTAVECCTNISLLSSSCEFPVGPLYGASIAPCPWLGRTDMAKGLPLYLWDVKAKRTCLVEALYGVYGQCPEYVAISHTWGRWRNFDKPIIPVPGTPWRVPQNKRFEVTELPQILGNLSYRYIWLDLLTIPQECPSASWYEKQQIEIAKQAVIFTKAKIAVAWLNDIHCWSVLPSVICYLAYNYLKDSYLRGTNTNTVRIEALSSRIKETSASADMHIELLQSCGDDSDSGGELRINGWFTSLWTLQEVCLRPDMKFCNSRWEFLETSPNRTIGMNDLFALLHVVEQENVSFSEPMGVRELRSIVRNLGMENLLRPSQTSIITMGNKRHCTERRAEAIMSAIGATDWFMRARDGVKDTLLVLGLYPPSFVNEVREKVGSASFFSTVPKGLEFREVLADAICSKTQDYKAVGSLMPFGPGMDLSATEKEVDLLMVEHPTLKDWVIESTGCVRISKIGLIASSDPLLRSTVPLESDLKCAIITPFPEKDKGHVEWDSDLNLWAKSGQPGMPRYAVCTGHSEQQSRGILFQTLEPGVMVKIGIYYEMKRPDYEMPEMQKVDWLVL